MFLRGKGRKSDAWKRPGLGSSSTPYRAQDREVAFVRSPQNSALVCGSGEEIFYAVPNVQDAKASLSLTNDLGTLYVTSLRLLWVADKFDVRAGISIGMDTIQSIDVTSKIGGGFSRTESRLLLQIDAQPKWGDYNHTVFEFTFVLRGCRDVRVFHNISAVRERYLATRLFRDLKLRGNIFCMKVRKPRLLDGETVYSCTGAVSTRSGQRQDRGSLYITSVRTIWLSGMRAHYVNLSAPHILLESVRLHRPSKLMGLTFSMGGCGGSTPAKSFIFHFADVKSMAATHSTLLSVQNIHRTNPNYGVHIKFNRMQWKVAVATLGVWDSCGGCRSADSRRVTVLKGGDEVLEFESRSLDCSGGRKELWVRHANGWSIARRSGRCEAKAQARGCGVYEYLLPIDGHVKTVTEFRVDCTAELRPANTTGLSLRFAPSLNYKSSILLPNGALVRGDAAARSGWIKVTHIGGAEIGRGLFVSMKDCDGRTVVHAAPRSPAKKNIYKVQSMSVGCPVTSPRRGSKMLSPRRGSVSSVGGGRRVWSVQLCSAPSSDHRIDAYLVDGAMVRGEPVLAAPAVTVSTERQGSHDNTLQLPNLSMTQDFLKLSYLDLGLHQACDPLWLPLTAKGSRVLFPTGRRFAANRIETQLINRKAAAQASHQAAKNLLADAEDEWGIHSFSQVLYASGGKVARDRDVVYDPHLGLACEQPPDGLSVDDMWGALGMRLGDLARALAE